MMHILFIALRDTHKRGFTDDAYLSDVSNLRPQLEYGMCTEILFIVLLTEVVESITFLLTTNFARRRRLTLEIDTSLGLLH
jgi:hypothetical protein